jgi:hypothetical protein
MVAVGIIEADEVDGEEVVEGGKFVVRALSGAIQRLGHDVATLWLAKVAGTRERIYEQK